MTKKSKQISYQSEEQKELMKFGIVLVVVVLLIGIVYFVSKKFVVDKSLFEIQYTAGTINYERAIIGTVFNRPSKEYYVIIYDESGSDAVYYSAISTKYTDKQEGALPVYHVDLNNELNKSAYVGSDGTSNPKATKASELKLKDLTLIRIKDGKITKYIENLESIQKELAVTKEKKS